MGEIFDVVVVGAGVSGLSAGLSAALGEARTFVVERKKQIGDPVKCGEFIPSFAEIKKIMPNANSIGNLYGMLTKDAVCNATRRIRVFSPKNQEYDFSFDGLVLQRMVLERNLAAKAQEVGATVETATNAETIEGNRDETKICLRSQNGERFVTTRLVIGADGFPSRTGQWLNFVARPKPEDVALCIQQSAEDARQDDDTVEVYFGKVCAPGGYAWIIPKGGGEANVGVGVRLSYLERRSPAVDFLNFFVKKHPVSSQHFVGTRFKPPIAKTLFVGGLLPKIQSENALLVGDAAGTLIAINGSGIPTASVSGQIAGETASQHLKGNCELSSYVTALNREIGDVVKRGYLYRRLGDMFARSDEVLDNLLQIIGPDNLAKVIKCEPIWPPFN